jgi:hypothetical protein
MIDTAMRLKQKLCHPNDSRLQRSSGGLCLQRLILTDGTLHYGVASEQRDFAVE